MELLILLLTFIGGIIFAFPVAFLKRKGINLANFEDSKLLTEVVETIKSKINKETLSSVEEYKKLLDIKILPFEIERELKNASYKYTLDRIIELDKRINQSFWIYLDARHKQSGPTDSDREILLDLRRFIFDSTLYIDKDIISDAIKISVNFDTLLDAPREELYRVDFYKKISSELNPNIDSLKEKLRKKYHFDQMADLIISAKELESVFSTPEPKE